MRQPEKSEVYTSDDVNKRRKDLRFSLFLSFFLFFFLTGTAVTCFTLLLRWIPFQK